MLTSSRLISSKRLHLGGMLDSPVDQVNENTSTHDRGGQVVKFAFVCLTSCLSASNCDILGSAEGVLRTSFASVLSTAGVFISDAAAGKGCILLFFAGEGLRESLNQYIAADVPKLERRVRTRRTKDLRIVHPFSVFAIPLLHIPREPSVATTRSFQRGTSDTGRTCPG